MDGMDTWPHLDINRTYLFCWACVVDQKTVWGQLDLRGPSSFSDDFLDLVEIMQNSDYFRCTN